MSSKGKIFVVTAPSGAGKTTIVHRILKLFPELKFSISATTRPKRNKEIDGKDYFFLSEKEFEKRIEKKEFVEWEKFYDYYYGTLKNFIDNVIGKNNSIILDVDVKGAVNIIDIYKDAVSIFIMPPDKETLASRLIKRQTENEVDLKKRLERAEMELKYCNKFHNKVINSDLDKAVFEVKNIIDKKLNEE